MPATTTPIPLLDTDHALSALRALRARQPVKYAAFYSSQLGGIVTDPALMVHSVRRPHGPPRPRDLRHRRPGRRADLRSGSAPRSLPALGGALEAEAAMPARARCATSSSQTAAASGQRDGAIRYWMSSGPGSLELSPAAGAEPGFFVMVFAGLVLSGAVVHRRAQGDDHHLPDQAGALRHHQEHELPAQRADADGSQGGRARQRRVHRRGRTRRRELEHECGVRHQRRRAAPSEVRSHPRRLHVAAGCWNWRRRWSRRACSPASRSATSRWPTRAPRARCCCSAAPIKVAPIVDGIGQPIGDGKPGPGGQGAARRCSKRTCARGDRLIDVPAIAPPQGPAGNGATRSVM